MTRRTPTRAGRPAQAPSRRIPANGATARNRAALAALALLVTAGCATAPDPVPEACFGEPAALLSALADAPGDVRLADGTRLSGCVGAARSDGDLQSLGLAFLRTADMLRARAAMDTDAALRLGYLAGAVTSGADGTKGAIAAQLARRVDQVATLDPGASAAAMAALEQGRGAGRRDG